MPRDRRRRRDVSTESYSYSDYSESRSPSPRKRKHRSSRKDRHKSSRRSGRDGGGDRRRGGGGGGGGGGKATDSNVDRFIEENELNPDAAARLRTADREVRERVLEQGWNVIDNARNASAVVISRIRKHEQEMGIAGPRGLGGGGGGGGGGGHKAKEHVLLQVGSEYASPNAQAKKAAGRRASRFKVTKTTDEALEACEADDVGCHADVPTP
mmetsp:Transcript_75612/g.164988  ORF Transcript_75612/g.164988 Transcript_75612/m.164988 type:complete len:212 (-) Transcript_75612:29-664(-)